MPKEVHICEHTGKLEEYQSQCVPRCYKQASSGEEDNATRTVLPLTVAKGPKRRLDNRTLSAKTLVVSCGVCTMDESGYGMSKKHHALDEEPYERNLYEKYRTTINHNFNQNFRCQKLDQVQVASGEFEERRIIFVDLTGIITHVSDDLKKHKGTHPELMNLILNQKGLKKALKPLSALMATI